MALIVMVLIGLLAAPAMAAQIPAEPRLALVIGNSTYRESPLTNPVNDARAMTAKLQQLGFTVIKRENAGREDMLKAARDFGNQLKNGGVGLFYYAGHGIQSRGQNYLIPVDADIQSEDELSTRAYNVNEILEKMDTARNRLNVMVLDACRNNPFARSFRSSARGLARIDAAPSGMLVAYATSPGSTAADGSGSNGLYTEQLLQALSEPGLKLEEVFKRVRVSVKEKSGGEQLPWEMSSVTGDFYFNPQPDQVAATQLALAQPVLAQPLAAQPVMREIAPVLVPRKLFDSYQLAASLPLTAPPTVGQFTRSGQFLALAAKDKTLKVWDASSGNAVITEVSFGEASLSPDRRYVLGMADNAITLADLENDGARTYFKSLHPGITQAVLLPNGKRLLVYAKSRGFGLLKVETGEWLGEFAQVEGEPMFAISPSGHRVVTWGSRDSNLKLWETEKGGRVEKLSEHWKPVGLARFSRDGSLLLTVAQDDRAILWRTSDGDDVRKFSFGDNSPVPTEVEFLDDNKHALVTLGKTRLQIWDMSTGTAGGTLVQDLPIKHTRFSPDRTRLFVSGVDRSIRVFDLTTRSPTTALSGMELLDFSEDGRRILALDGEGVRLLDALTLAPLGRMPGQIAAFAGPKKAGVFATASPDGKLSLWSLEQGDPVAQLKGHLDAVSAVQFSRDGRRFLSFGADRSVRLWAFPDVQDVDKLNKDPYEPTAEYQRRVANWSSSYHTLVTLGEYNADLETQTVRIGEHNLSVPIPRDEARKLAGQRQAMLLGRLKFFDLDNLQLIGAKLSRLP